MFNERYKVLSNLAQGGFGETFLVEDTKMPSHRLCVIKRLKPQLRSVNLYEMAKQRFAREAAILEVLGDNHDQIPCLYAYFEEENEFYLVQEWIEGDPWHRILQRRNQLPEAEVKQFLRDLLPVLDYIHRQDIIHRDIKPSNVICRAQDQKPVLIDFGSVKEKLSNTNPRSLSIGTPGFMAPEQVSGKPLPASDLYSLGISAITLVTGLYPNSLEQDTTGKLLWSDHGQHMTPEFRNFLNTAIDPDLKKRFLTAQEMLAALSDLSPAPTQPEPRQIANRGFVKFWRRRCQPVLNAYHWSQIFKLSGITTLIIISLRFVGWLEPYELQMFDRLMRQRRPYEAPDERLLIVEANAEDIAKQTIAPNNQASLSDDTLTQVLSKLQEYDPIAIAFDIYRDFPVDSNSPQLTQFLQQPNFFGICKGRDSVAGDTQGIAPPPELTRNQITFSDVITDADQVLRRHLLSQQSPDLSDPCTAMNHLSFTVALYYLTQQGVTFKNNHKGDFVLLNPESQTKVILPELKSHTGGYQNIDARGRQILLNYRILRSPKDIARRLTINELLQDKIPPETKARLKNRIIFVGVVSPINSSGDYWMTPYSAGQPLMEQETFGLYLQAQMTSQLLSAVLDQRPLFWTMPWWLEWIWIGSWSVLTTVVIWNCYSIAPKIGVTLVIFAGLYGTCYYILLQGGWLPLLPSAIAITSCVVFQPNH